MKSKIPFLKLKNKTRTCHFVCVHYIEVFKCFKLHMEVIPDFQCYTKATITLDIQE